MSYPTMPSPESGYNRAEAERNELRNALEQAISSVQNDQGVTSDNGLDDQVIAALHGYNDSRTTDDLWKVRETFERQLSGENARIRQALWNASTR
jgi:hypothetical protein